MGPVGSCGHFLQARVVKPHGSLNQQLCPIRRPVLPHLYDQPFSKCSKHYRPDVSRARRRATLTQAAARPQSQREGPEKTNFFTKLIRPLRDFGLGKSSLWEGGVGMFIFAGIGMISSRRHLQQVTNSSIASKTS